MLLALVCLCIGSPMAVAEIPYWGFDGKEHVGQLVVRRDLVPEVKAIFSEIRAVKFPIAKMVPISKYRGDDEASMADNNTSGFNYRKIKGSRRLSNHAFGKAIDINPLINPFVSKHRSTSKYDPKARGALTAESPVVRIFKRHGWSWGGEWKRVKDYQHFEKRR